MSDGGGRGGKGSKSARNIKFLYLGSGEEGLSTLGAESKSS